MTKMMINTTFEVKLSILANTYHYEFGEELSELGDWFEDWGSVCVLAASIENGLCIATDKGKTSIDLAFDSLCEELDIDEDIAWTDFKHWNNQFAD
jgi:hypothetical protein